MFNLLSANTQLMSLQLGLREFGLHPVEWRIIKKWRYIQLAGL